MTLIEMLTKALGGDEELAIEIQSKLGEFMIPKNKFNEVNEENKTLKADANKHELKVTELNDRIEELETSNLSEQELIQHQLDKAHEQIKNNKIEKNTLMAENKFVTAGFSKEEYQSLLATVVTEDEQATMEVVDGFITLAGAKSKEAEKKLKESLLGNQDLPDGDKPKIVTKEEFDTWSYPQRFELSQSNPELYKQLINE